MNIKKTILILEDEPVIANDLSWALADMGFDSFISPSGEEAMLQFKDQLPDLIIANYWLAGKASGVLISEKLHAPVIYLTGVSAEELKTHPNYSSRNRTLFKPFTGRQLREAVNFWLSKTVGED